MTSKEQIIELHTGISIKDWEKNNRYLDIRINNPAFKTPEEWQKIKEVIIYDADGWRFDRKPFDEPISEQEFNARALKSTVMVEIGSKWDKEHPYNSH